MSFLGNLGFSRKLTSMVWQNEKDQLLHKINTLTRQVELYENRLKNLSRVCGVTVTACGTGILCCRMFTPSVSESDEKSSLVTGPWCFATSASSNHGVVQTYRNSQNENMTLTIEDRNASGNTHLPYKFWVTSKP